MWLTRGANWKVVQLLEEELVFKADELTEMSPGDRRNERDVEFLFFFFPDC